PSQNPFAGRFRGTNQRAATHRPASEDNSPGRRSSAAGGPGARTHQRVKLAGRRSENGANVESVTHWWGEDMVGRPRLELADGRRHTLASREKPPLRKAPWQAGFSDQPPTAHRRAPPSKTTPLLGRGPHPSAPADRPASGSNSPEIGRNMGRESNLRPTGGSTWRRTTLDGASRPHEKDTVLRPKTRSRQKPDGKAVFLVKPE